MKIKTKLILGYVVVSLFIIVVTLTGLYGFKGIESAYRVVTNQSDPTIIYLREIQYYFTGQANDERGFLLTAGPEFKKEIGDKADQIKKRISFIQGMMENNEEIALLNKINETHTRFTEMNYKVIDVYNSGQVDEAKKLSFGDGRKTRKELETVFNQLVQLKQEEAAQQKQAAQQIGSKVIEIIVIVSILAIVLSITFGVYLARNIIRPILKITEHMKNDDLSFKAEINSNDEIGELIKSFEYMVNIVREMVSGVQANAEHVATYAEELNATSEQSSRVTNQVSMAMSEVAAATVKQEENIQDAVISIENMLVTFDEISTDISSVESMSGKTTQMTYQGNADVKKAIDQMNTIGNTVDHSAEVVRSLGDRSREIGQIIDVISNIAGQTNLLALNAAIEAARAGEQGRGFSVVAEEVRKLAEQSQGATGEISKLIESIQSETDRAVNAMNDGTREAMIGVEVVIATGQSFNDIAAQVQELSTKIKKISKAVHVMTDASQHVSSVINDIELESKEISAQTQTVSTATEEQSAGTQEIASFSHDLAMMAQELQQDVHKLKM
ncbi:methyl-accepting chemotaxis protein [Pelosinus sp. sgz500959]|uniref:methyl-accepting chemotaxis protein n=1 Tax=Pelosinus sp. sgz500959 TaxID=3242472 RepID=UPI00366AE4F6